MAKKEKSVELKDNKTKAPKTPTPKAPEQPEMTEEQAFAQYMSNMISGAVLDHEQIKTKTVEALKAMGQQLGLYMRALAKVQAEKKALEEKLKKK